MVIARADIAPRLAAAFADVDIRPELQSRLPHPRNQTAEDRSLALLATEMADNPRNMLQKLAETALEYCNADTAGISLLETVSDQKVFRWEALAGVFANKRNSTMPRDASPCGVTIDEDSTQLMYLAERCFPALQADPPFVEALLIPFHVRGQAIGTIWVVSHRPDRGFDREDERFIKMLGKVASAGWQLWKISEQAERANHSKDDLLACISHELRTPLSAILMSANLLSSKKLSNETAERLIEIIDRNAKLQLLIVNDLLEVSRMVAGKIHLEIGEVDVVTVVHSAFEMVHSLAEAKNIAVTISEASLPRIPGDERRLQQVIGNLLTNSIKFTPPRGAISIDMTVHDASVHICVMDNGIGISAECFPFIFDRFRQTEEGKRYGGLGIGLSVVRELVEAHGGSVSVKSGGVNQGSLFTVILPLHKTSELAGSASAA